MNSIIRICYALIPLLILYCFMKGEDNIFVGFVYLVPCLIIHAMILSEKK